MAGKTNNTGSVKAVSAINPLRALDFRHKYPGMHLVIVSKKTLMHGGQTTQYEYFKALGLEELQELPHPHKVLMGEPQAQKDARKKVALDLNDQWKRSTGVKKDETDASVVTVNTEFGGED